LIVYWIRKEEHSDIYTEGYVGITKKTLIERVREHKKNRRHHSIVASQLQKHSDLVCTVVHEVETLEEALELEAMYRPTHLIGWNLQRGGEIGVESEWYSNPENRLRHSMKTSEATKRGIALKDTTEARSERARLNYQNNLDSYKGMSVGEKNSRAILTESDVVKIKYELLPQGLTDKEIAAMFEVKHYVIGFIRRGKNWKHV
jgi:hypothetical protein